MTRIPGYIDGRRTRVGGVPNWGPVPNVLIPGSMEAFGIYEEFMRYILADAAEPSVPDWLCGHTGAVLSIANELGGAVLITTPAVDEDTGQLQLGDGVGGMFFPRPDRDIWFEARVRQSILGVNTLNLAFGLQDPGGAAEILADAGAGPAIQNHLMFLTLDTGAGVNAWSFRGGKGAAVDTNALTINLVSQVYHTYGFHVYGHDATLALPGFCDVYYDRVLVAAGQVLDPNIPITGLAPFICIKTGSATIESVAVDYIMCVQQR